MHNDLADRIQMRSQWSFTETRGKVCRSGRSTKLSAVWSRAFPSVSTEIAATWSLFRGPCLPKWKANCTRSGREVTGETVIRRELALMWNLRLYESTIIRSKRGISFVIYVLALINKRSFTAQTLSRKHIYLRNWSFIKTSWREKKVLFKIKYM